MQLVEYIPNYVVFDLETTGTSVNYDEVIEISAIKVHNHKVAAEFTSLVNPGRRIPYGASEVNGITTTGAHRALNDCRMNQAVYECLGREFKKKPSLIKKCPKCGQLMQKRNGKFGMFWGCGGYPDCRYTENL